MATLGSIRAELIADSDRWGKGLGTARTSLTKFQKFAIGSFAAVAAAGGAAAGIFATKILPQFDQLSQIRHLSRELDLGAEELQGYRFAALQTGVEVEEMGERFRNFALRLGEIRAGEGEGLEAIQRLGISAKELDSLTTDEKILRIAEAIHQLPNHSDKILAADQLFGGQELLNMLDQGREGLIQFRAEADKLDILFGDDDLQSVADADAALKKLTAKFEVLWKRIAVNAAPAIEDMADAMTTLATDVAIRDTISELVTLMASMAKAVPPATKAFREQRNEIDEYTLKLLELNDRLRSVTDGATKAADRIAGIPGLGAGVMNGLGASQFLEEAHGFRAEIEAIEEKAKEARKKLAGGPLAGAVPNAKPVEPKLDAIGADQQGGRGPMRFLIEQAAQFAKQGGQAFREELEKAEAAHQRMVQRQEELADRTLAIVERNKTGIELAYDRLTDFREVQNRVGVNTQQRELIAIRDEFLASLPQPEETKQPAPTQFAAALQRGSAGAFSAIAAAMRQDQDNDRAIPQKQLAVTEEQKALLDSLQKEIAALNGKVLPNEKLVPIKTLKGGGR